ncbi:hypothetical protein [Anaerotignum propionicum]|uniref:hypothetical protein n=1 Tax=Anaerotignum propionicum TaxID=28446 RepID=UPI0012FF3C12|nr:hypothetical protein [Anaerotignum propionicum]MEA5057092.1 hypothetical protein [Anaerotignum propionicum]
MSYQCRLMDKECDGCGDCQDITAFCPNCGETNYEVMYVINNNWVGCDQCVKRIYFPF